MPIAPPPSRGCPRRSPSPPSASPWSVTNATIAWPVCVVALANPAARRPRRATIADSTSAVESRWPETLTTSSIRPITHSGRPGLDEPSRPREVSLPNRRSTPRRSAPHALRGFAASGAGVVGTSSPRPPRSAHHVDRRAPPQHARNTVWPGPAGGRGPRRGDQIAPVSVCHHVSTIGQRSPQSPCDTRATPSG